MRQQWQLALPDCPNCEAQGLTNIFERELRKLGDDFLECLTLGHYGHDPLRPECASRECTALPRSGRDQPRCASMPLASLGSGDDRTSCFVRVQKDCPTLNALLVDEAPVFLMSQIRVRSSFAGRDRETRAAL